MTNYNLALRHEQEQRLVNDQIACETRVKEDTDVYYLGEWDGKMAFEPKQPDNQHYWQGYCVGLKQYWLNLKPCESKTDEIF